MDNHFYDKNFYDKHYEETVNRHKQKLKGAPEFDDRSWQVPYAPKDYHSYPSKYGGVQGPTGATGATGVEGTDVYRWTPELQALEDILWAS